MASETNKQQAREFLPQAYQRQLQGQRDDAVVVYQNPLELHPTAEAYTFLGWTYSFIRCYEQAM